MAQRRRRGCDRRARGDAASPRRLLVPRRWGRYRDADGARGRRPGRPARAIPHIPHGSRTDVSAGLRLGERLVRVGLEILEFRGTYLIGPVLAGMRTPPWAARDAMVAAGVATEEDVARWASAFDWFDAAAIDQRCSRRCLPRSDGVEPSAPRLFGSVGRQYCWSIDGGSLSGLACRSSWPARSGAHVTGTGATKGCPPPEGR